MWWQEGGDEGVGGVFLCFGGVHTGGEGFLWTQVVVRAVGEPLEELFLWGRSGQGFSVAQGEGEGLEVWVCGGTGGDDIGLDDGGGG